MILWEIQTIPFDAWSMPSQNEEHVKLTPQNVEFALNEIYSGTSIGNILADQDKKSALIFVENENQGVVNGKIYRSSSQGQASRGGNGMNNNVFGYIGDWSVDLTVSENLLFKLLMTLAHLKTINTLFIKALIYSPKIMMLWVPLVGVLLQQMHITEHQELVLLQWFFNNIAGTSSGNGPFILDANNNVGQTVFGYASETGNISFASGFRNTAAGTTSVAMGNFNYATGDSSVAIEKRVMHKEQAQ